MTRRLHYAFSHQLLPRELHSDPDRMLAELRTPLRDGFLFFLWEELGKSLGEPDPSGAVGLTVAGVDEQDGDTYALIAMPAPLAEGESHYALVVYRPGRPQLFVLDRTDSATEGSLAKLGPDGSRLSYGRAPLDRDAFLATVVELVRTEPDASAGGAGGSFGGVWGPSSAPASNPGSVGAVWGPPSAPASGGGSVGGGSVGAVWGPSSSPSGGSPPVGAVWGGGSSGAGPGAAWGSAQPNQVGAVWGPGGKAPPRKSGGSKGVMIGCMLLIPLTCLTGTVISYEGGDDFDDEPFEITAEITTSAEGEEVVSITRTGGPAYAWYDVSGPGETHRCRFSSYSRASTETCQIPLAALDERNLRYEVRGSGMPSRVWGMSLGDLPHATRDVSVERPTHFVWSSRQRATVCVGVRCRLTLDRQGRIELADAPPGATVRIGAGTPGTTVAIDLVQEANRVGVARLLAASPDERASIPNITVTLADGHAIGGAVDVSMRELGQLLVSRLAQLEGANLGTAEGSAAVWIQDGRLQSVEGSPARVQDIGRVVLATTREVPAGRCGPYSLWGQVGGNHVPRTRTETSVSVFDRSGERVIARRTFRGATPSCPYSVSLNDRTIQRRDTTEADAFARTQLQPS